MSTASSAGKREITEALREATKRARTAEASCAAKHAVLVEVARWIDDQANDDDLPTDTTALLHEAIANPNPGAPLLERIEKLEAVAEAASALLAQHTDAMKHGRETLISAAWRVLRNAESALAQDMEAS